MKKNHSLGLYVHIPFCAAKCGYCDFYSLPCGEQKMDSYVRALGRHLADFAPRAASRAVDTVYFGGGTPSYLGHSRLAHLLQAVKKYYHLTADAEITLEANPDSARDSQALLALRHIGFNRISLGAQSADNEMLRRIGRVHTWEQVAQAVQVIRAAGFDNLSLDLMYGLPEQTTGQWQSTLAAAIALSPEHISAYGLKLEPGTPLCRQREQLSFPDDDTQAQMYLLAVALLENAGYAQYEISNFARPHRVSRHNLRYWALGEYIGFGPGAHSDFGGRRFSWARDLDGYVSGEIALAEDMPISPAERVREYAMLSLRTAEGLSPEVLERRYGVSFAPLERIFTTCQAHGLADRTTHGWRLTPRGFLVSNAIINRVLEALEA